MSTTRLMKRSNEVTSNEPEPILNISDFLTIKFPGLPKSEGRRNSIVQKTLKKLIHEKEINEFLNNHIDKTSTEFIDEAFEYLNFSYCMSCKDRVNIPSTGKVIIVANHPLGSIDGLCLLRAVQEVRQDVKILSNEILEKIPSMKSSVISSKMNLDLAIEVVSNDEALIVFPAGFVSNFSWRGVLDQKWNDDFLKIAAKTNAPILPVYIDAKNSPGFYMMSFINKKIGKAMLPGELLKKTNKEIRIKVSEMIPYREIKKTSMSSEKTTKALKKIVYQISKINSGDIPFETVKSICSSVDRRDLKSELKNAELIGLIGESKKIYLYDYTPNSPVIKELGRLRECAFRCVDEGTGESIDTDPYDQYYKHLILWDEEELEIIGAYRLGMVHDIIKNKGIKGLYTSEFFNYQECSAEFLDNGMELGRAFIQPKYWGKRGLEYLWYGIGACLKSRPEIKYLFGPVSVSNQIPEKAHQLIVAFFKFHLGAKDNYARAINQYQVNDESKKIIQEKLNESDYSTNVRALQKELKTMGVRLPMLFKQYTELCETEGVSFLDFDVDKEFNTIDGLILLNIDHFKEAKRKRYLQFNFKD
ncbi:MAG: GNAT family N-acetyltransferase [Planctomycetota bacterium]|nr:MAG: GNAT family N-acetyltransferase [Planctomycetota bacterium]